MDESPLTPRELNASLRALAREDRGSGVSAAVRARLLQEVRTVRSTRRRTILKSSLLMAALAVAITVPVWQLARLDTPRRQPPGASSATAPDGEWVTAFYPLEYSMVPMSSSRLIRMEVPLSALAAFGLSDAREKSDPAVSNMLLADVLVGDDGLARAVRFVRPPRIDSRKESVQ
jgi:hypothetical protein